MHFYTLMPMIACCWLTLCSVSAQTLTLRAAEVEAAAGGEVCVDIKAGAFRKIIAMQYTLRWDPGKLKFQGVEGFRLPYLTEDNFGAHRSAEGILTFIWLDNSLRGVSLPDNSAIFQLCFQVRGKPGETAKVTFSQQPTPFEAVNAAEQVLGIKGIEGAVRIE